MKKKFPILTAAAFVAAMTFAFTGCGAKDAEPAVAPAATEKAAAETEDTIVKETAETAEAETETLTEETTKASTEETEDAIVEETAETAEDDADTADNASKLDGWVNSSEMQDAMKAMSDSQEGMSISLSAADDKTVVFSFTFTEQLPVADDEEKAAVAKLFEEAMSLQQDTFIEMRDELVAETGINDVVVRIEYINADGTILYAIDYTK